ncbi:peroxiredoxin [Paracoccus suum]|uniref:Glutathione-dependent peroxiredoxin n=1 Tax=Paracoccus suum TaxID=2259340 RepID=A0A344PPH6_9RHOB|nr:peroxiredoxin [Paracoccus suum]AXC51281.1 peroxiredoxin [Paracoccus suum]
MIGKRVPQVTFQTRVRDEAVGGPNPYRWQTLTTDDYFKGKRVVLFSLPGAFTPTCSTYQLPGFEAAAEQLAAGGIDAIYCLSVNDSFVMNQWAKSQGLSAVKVIPDGSGQFTKGMGMLVRKDNLGFGPRSWRYAAVVDDGEIIAWFEEPGRCDDCADDPYGETSPERIAEWVAANPAGSRAAPQMELA